MKWKSLIVVFGVTILLTLSSLFLKTIPCISWSSEGGMREDLVPHHTSCNIFYGFGPHYEYYYLTTNPTVAFILTFFIALIIIFVIGFLVQKIKSKTQP
ncbi:MAG: hypothetical protein WC548_04275 [Candidatus Pacearchaeota archaeon]